MVQLGCMKIRLRRLYLRTAGRRSRYRFVATASGPPRTPNDLARMRASCVMHPKASRMPAMPNVALSKEQREGALRTLSARFEKNMHRHRGLEWAGVKSKLEGNAAALWSLNEMERTGGEPDVVAFDKNAGRFAICDCSRESPKDRRNICYDYEGQHKREKEGLHPRGNVVDMAASMGIEPLTEEQYRELQKLDEFDTKTQSWLKTPADIRRLGGAIFADRRFGHVFVYHNTAPCFYSGRAFRGLLQIEL